MGQISVCQQGTRVKEIKKTNKDDVLNLEQCLRPLWLTTYYNCSLFDWCQDIPNKGILSIVAHWIGISTGLFLLFGGFGHQAYHLWLEIQKPDSSINSIMPNLIWTSNFPAAILTALVFLFKRREFLSFFKDWGYFEEQTIVRPKAKLRRLFCLVYCTVAVEAICSTLAVSALVLNHLEASYLLSYYPFLREKLTVPGILLIHYFSLFWMFIFVVLADLVPAWTFYHAGQALRSFALEIKEHFLETPDGSRNKMPCLQQIRIRYEMLFRLTKRANRLFGWITLVNHGVMFFFICAELYNYVLTIRLTNSDPWTSLLMLNTFLIRFLISFLMSAHLDTSTDKLRLAISVALTNENQMSPEDYKKCKLFLSRIRESPLAANPLGLYRITPSLLLIVFNLIVTYAVVLLQSK